MNRIFRILPACVAVVCMILPAGAYAQASLSGSAERPRYVEMDFPQVGLAGFAKDKKGFISLFDGTSMEGWRAYGKETLPDRWVIEDGAMKFDSKTSGSRGSIIFAHKFQNFILDMEWKISENGNSGIFYLVQEVRGQGIATSAPEAQVLDNDGHPDAKLGRDGNRMASSLYDLVPAVPQNANPHGEWNKVRIVVRNGKVEHWQNGKRVVRYTLWTPEWNAMLADSKFSLENWPDAWWLMTNAGGDSREGYIGLQDHGNDVWFRNIKIKIL